MLRVARLRDAKWQRPADVREADEKPRTMSFGDAVEIASALWVKEAAGVADLKFLMFDDWSSSEARRRGASLALAPPGLCGGCAGQFGRDGGRAVDARPTSARAPRSAIRAGGLRTGSRLRSRRCSSRVDVDDLAAPDADRAGEQFQPLAHHFAVGSARGGGDLEAGRGSARRKSRAFQHGRHAAGKAVGEQNGAA